MLRRLGGAALALAGLSVLCFALPNWAPGDFLTDAAVNPALDRSTIDAMRVRYGLDEPLPVRYGRWLRGLTRGELGLSLSYQVDAATLLLPRLRATLVLNAFALLLALVAALPAAAAVGRSGPAFRRAADTAMLAVLSVPEIVLVLILLATALTWEIPLPGGQPEGVVGLLQGLAVPGLALALGAAPIFYRHARAAFDEALGAPFVAAARHAGVPEVSVQLRYVLPAAANPLISLLGTSLGNLLSASLVVETVTGWPGLGPLLLEAVLARDSNVVAGAVLLAATCQIAGNVAADLALMRLDPRIRL
ncbi:MAG: ABC transporter permease [Bryobacterales bacterium]|nr:ABC transporter permease [Bryobacterales bacterium]